MFTEVRLLNFLTILLYGMLVMLLLAFGFKWFASRPYFVLKSIYVEGDLQHVSLPSIRGSVLPKVKGNFFTVNLDQVRETFETVSWVRKASVRREWPNKLVVVLSEHEAIATWDDGKNDNRLLSKLGEVFVANQAEAEDNGQLPELAGPEGSEKDVLMQYLLLKEMLAGLSMNVQSLALSPRYAWSLQTDSGLKIELGRETEMSQQLPNAINVPNTVKERVARWMRAYPQVKALFPGKLFYVDLRYPNGFALKASGVSILQESKPKK